MCENCGAEYVSDLLSMLVRKLLKVPAVCRANDWLMIVTANCTHLYIV